MVSAETIARVMGRRVYQGAALVPGPNHSRASRPQDPRTLRARRLLADNVSLDHAWAEINGNRPAAEATIEALVYSLRRGAAELSKPDTLRRRSELVKPPPKTLFRPPQNFKPQITP